MIEVIKHGKTFEKATCNCCCCEFTFAEVDMIENIDCVVCPECNALVEAKDTLKGGEV